MMKVKKIRPFPGGARQNDLLSSSCGHFTNTLQRLRNMIQDNLRDVAFDPKNKLGIVGSSRACGLNGKGGKAVRDRARPPDE
jgi:hypothetical protein